MHPMVETKSICQKTTFYYELIKVFNFFILAIKIVLMYK